MAKAKNTYPYPMSITNAAFKEFVRVIDENKNKALVIGRVAYEIVKKDAKTYTIKRILEYHPRSVKGHIEVIGHPVYGTFDYWVFSEQPVSEHRQMLIDCFGRCMKEGNLYVRLSEQLMKYSFI